MTNWWSSCWGFPDACKLHRGVTKRVLREGLRGVLPETIRVRMSKLGFVTPEEHWMREEAPEKFRQAVRDAVAASQGCCGRRRCGWPMT
ncbi:MAG: asparagine synthase C-terminal domain-containing protein [Rhodocyclaceae bacterium]|nr:asparagine synthase C-terminal domain-containing protein [Rhodocyclaceae bacterium]